MYRWPARAPSPACRTPSWRSIRSRSQRPATTGEPQFQPAPPCSDPTKPTTGIIADPDAQKLGFCVDVNAISRSGQKCDAQDCSAWSGNLTIPVLFVNDPRFSFG